MLTLTCTLFVFYLIFAGAINDGGVTDTIRNDVINTVGFRDTSRINLEYIYGQNYGISILYNFQISSCSPSYDCSAKFVRIFDEFTVNFYQINNVGTRENDSAVTLKPSILGSTVIVDNEGLYVVDYVKDAQSSSDSSTNSCNELTVLFGCFHSNGCVVDDIILETDGCSVDLSYIGFLKTQGPAPPTNKPTKK